MSNPRRWTPSELTRDAETAKGAFREHRLREPLALYSQFFSTFATIFGNLIDRLPSLAGDLPQSPTVSELVGNDDVLTGLRYLTAPPISKDDLKTLAETTLSKTALHTDPDKARRVRDTIFQVLDSHRFPWISEEREPTDEERMRAIVASAVLVATRKVETARRSSARRVQEEAVKTLLKRNRFTEVPARDIPLLDVAPAPREFCGESQLGDSRADIVVRLPDRRAMPIECKATNSTVNSFKRINHETTGKARGWIAGFGERHVVPVAVIAGVFNPANLAAAQDEGLAIIWAHRLEDLEDFLNSSGNPALSSRTGNTRTGKQPKRLNRDGA